MIKANNTETIVLFDGVCNLCDFSVNFIIDNDRKGYFKFASLQSPEGSKYLDTCGEQEREEVVIKEGDALGSVVLHEEGKCYRHSTAVLRIARKLDGAWPLVYAFIVIPIPIRDTLYKWIARNRYRWFGKQDACRIPTPELRNRFLDTLSSSDA